MALLKLKYKNSAYRPGFHAKYEPKEHTYIGHVLHFSWLSENEFALTTGEYDAPVRILDKRDIVAAWVDRSGLPDNVRVVDDKYVVTKGPFKRYSCTCTAYKWRNRCSHIDGVKHGS
jgi:hypothetical protein